MTIRRILSLGNKLNDSEILIHLTRNMGREVKIRISIMIFFSFLLALLDLMGVGAALIILFFVFSESIGIEPNQFVLKISDVTRLNDLNFNVRIAVVSFFLVFTFVGKSVLGIFLSSQINKFLSSESVKLGNTYLGKIFKMPYSFLANKKGQRVLQAATSGLENLYMNYLGGIINISVEMIVVVSLFISLVFVEPVGLAVVLFFFTVSVVPLNIILGRRLRNQGQALTEMNLISSNIILDGLSIFREIQISNREDYIVEMSRQARLRAIGIKAQIYTLNILTKYVIEIVIILSGIMFAGIQVWTSDTRNAIQSMLIFGLVSSRILPSLLKIHNTILNVKQSQGQARISIELLREIDEYYPYDSHRMVLSESNLISKSRNQEFLPRVEFRGVSYSHQADQSRNIVFSLNNVCMEIKPGETVGILGRSGSGKSTLLELLLGLRDPESGEVLVSGLSPRDASRRWSGSMAFVPQETKVVDLSIAENIALSKQIDEMLVTECLEVSQIANLFKDKNIKPDEHLGEFRNRLSGGEKQRLAIARALYTKPALLVLDESTSAMDIETERRVLEDLLDESATRTTVMVSHRPSTLLYMDRVIYMMDGKIVDFEHIEVLKKRYPQIKKLFNSNNSRSKHEK